MAIVRIGFVGAKHPHVFPRLQLACHFADRCAVVGVFDDDLLTRTHIQETYSVPVYDNYDFIKDCDLVFLEGYDYENPGYVEAALPHVKSIVIEKPGAPTVERMRELVSTCAQYPVNVSLGYMLQWSPIMTHLKKIISSGALGPITLARFHAAAPVGCAAEIWQSLEQDEGGVLWTDGCHLMRTVVELLGVPNTVAGMVSKLPTGEKVVSDFYKQDVLAGLGAEYEHTIGTLVHEDVAAAVMQYPDKLVTFDVTGWEAHGWVEQWRIELWGANATLEAGLMPPWYRLQVRRGTAEYPAGVHELRLSGPSRAETSLVPDEAYTQEFLNQLEVVEQGRQDQHDLRQALSTLEILHAIYKSSRDDAPTGVQR